MAKTFDLGAVTAYAYAVAHGFTGTEKDFGEQLNLALQAGGYAEQSRQYSLDAYTYQQNAKLYMNMTAALLNSIHVEDSTLFIGEEPEEDTSNESVGGTE